MALCRTLVKQLSACSKYYQRNYLNLTRTILTKSTTAKPSINATFSKRMMTMEAQRMNSEAQDEVSIQPLVEDRNNENGTINTPKLLSPPRRKGMTKLDTTAFNKEIDIPSITVPEKQIRYFVRKLKPYLLCAKKMQNIIEVETAKKKILLNPEKVTDFEEFFTSIAGEVNVEPDIRSSASFEKILFTYEHWSYKEILEAILPDEHEKFSGYSATGHVIHVNLKEPLLPFKYIIGEVLLDKINFAQTIVNKLEQIDSVYRNFQMDFLAGEHNTIVTLKENKCTFEFDFATVYWNSRLSTEHDKIVNLLDRNCVVFDVFAGVGPFAIPAALKKKCVVLANDLNPESTRWLSRNMQINKVSELVQVFNKDGREFIRNDVANYLKQKITSEDSSKLRFHVIMNLPAIAVEFLSAFWNLFDPDTNTAVENIPPGFQLTIHVYCFIKDVDGYKEKALQLVKEQLNYELVASDVIEVSSVRNVAQNKEMLRVSFNMPHEILRTTATATGGSGVKRKLSDAE